MPNNHKNNAAKANRPEAKPAPHANAGGKTIEDDIAATYNAFKEFEGKKYTGVKIGRGHTWNYEAGQWKERKVTPDRWEFTYAVNKRRKGNAPEGSGVPVGTQYHWYILAHQTVRKLDANEYTTAMIGTKHKLAHMRADKGTWSASDAAQKRSLINILQETIDQLQVQLDEDARAQKEARTSARAAKFPAQKPKKVRKPSRQRQLLEVA